MPPDLTPVEHNPFGPGSTDFVPVEHDPWAESQTHTAEAPNPVAPLLKKAGAYAQDFLSDPLRIGAGLKIAGNVAGNMLDLATESLRPTSYSDDDPRNALAEASTDMAMNLIGGGAPAAERGALGMAGGKIKAFHGSPHDFDRFDLSKIGTGEGAQAYGHGLYFAENPEVAEQYRKQLTRNSFRRGGVDGKMYDPNNPEHVASLYMHQTRTRAKAIKTIQEELSFGGALTEQRKPILDRVIDLLESDTEIPKFDPEANQGATYQVQINADPEHFLDWDAPLSEQHPKVRDALLNHPDSAVAAIAQQHGNSPSLMYNHLTQRKMPSNEPFPGDWRGGDDAASILRDAGIPGIKYLDQGSRRAGSGTSNYVVFNDKLIDIVKKYGLAGLIGGGSAHFSMHPVDHDPYEQQ